MQRFLRLLVGVFVVVLVLGPGVLGEGSGGEVGAEAQLEGLPAPGEAWDLVYMTDSTGYGVGWAYGHLAEEALGVEVRSHALTEGGLSAARMRELLDTPEYAERFAEAEIVVVFGNADSLMFELPKPDIETCLSSLPYVRPPPAPSSADDWAPYREMLGSVFERIWELRDGKPTVFRAVDMYSPVLRQWEGSGILEECMREWTMMSDQIRAAAEEHGVLMVSVFDALNGPEHDRRLDELGWLRDGLHLNVEGVAEVADALAAVGFTPLAPPPRRP